MSGLVWGRMCTGRNSTLSDSDRRRLLGYEEMKYARAVEWDSTSCKSMNFSRERRSFDIVFFVF